MSDLPYLGRWLAQQCFPVIGWPFWDHSAVARLADRWEVTLVLNRDIEEPTVYVEKCRAILYRPACRPWCIAHELAHHYCEMMPLGGWAAFQDQHEELICDEFANWTCGRSPFEEDPLIPRWQQPYPRRSRF